MFIKVPEIEPNSCKGCVAECGSELCEELGCGHGNYIFKETVTGSACYPLPEEVSQ